MKNLVLIYNPNSGSKTFKAELDTCITIFQQSGYWVHVFKTLTSTDIDCFIDNMERSFLDAVVVAGGDGTVNIVVNILIKYDLFVPIGIIPTGTANDFATFLKLPKDIEGACNVIAEGHTIPSDLGLVNDRYFINVCAAGLFSNISHTITPDLKNKLGKLAYYLKGLEQLPSLAPFPVKIKNSLETITDEIYLFIILNSSGTGGIENLSSYASINDGKFDFVGLKTVPNIVDLAKLIFKVVKGEHLNDENVIYFQDEYMEIESLSEDETFNYTDIDGEEGPLLPITVTNIKDRLSFFAPVIVDNAM